MSEVSSGAEVAVPKVGDVWKEIDPRFERYVRIESVGAGRRSIAIQTVIRSGSDWIPAARGHLTYADVDRFRGRRGGYALHQRPGAS